MAQKDCGQLAFDAIVQHHAALAPKMDNNQANKIPQRSHKDDINLLFVSNKY